MLWQTLCGDLVATDRRTDRGEWVDCKKCKRKLQQQEVGSRVGPALLPLAAAVEVLRDIAPLIDPDSGLPVLTPSTYRKRDCRCGKCPVCRHESEILRGWFIAPWREPPATERPKWRWPSVNAALEWYADLWEDGYPQKSLGEALSRIGQMGATIQSSASGDSRAIQDADDQAQLEIALHHAAKGEQAYDAPFVLRVLFEAAVGERIADNRGKVTRAPKDDAEVGRKQGLSGKAVGKLVKRMKRRLRDALKEWEMIA